MPEAVVEPELVLAVVLEEAPVAVVLLVAVAVAVLVADVPVAAEVPYKGYNNRRQLHMDLYMYRLPHKNSLHHHL